MDTNQSSPEKSKTLISNIVPKIPTNIPTTSSAEPAAILPSYYNASMVNANKFAEQQKKRKLLWSGKAKTDEKKEATWTATSFSQDSDGSKANKFFRLMGIKDGNFF